MAEKITPFIQAEQFIRALAGNNYFVEVSIWIVMCVVFFTVLVALWNFQITRSVRRGELK